MDLKVAKTYEERVKLIRDKGLLIDHEEDCIEFLKKANYFLSY